MGKGKRYSVFLTGRILNGGGANQVIDFNFDLRTLIPESCRGKKFLVHSAFDTGGNGGVLHTGVRVAVNLPQGFNKSFQNTNATNPVPQYVVLGIANLTIINNAANSPYKFHYTESECFVKMIEYPDVYPIKVQLTSAENLAFTQDDDFRLNLTFEEMDD